ncbi:hypothetical protein P9Y11_31540, partial [Bacillus cereus]|nr:hypothetical protein [Bacillus cereus]
MQQLLFLLPISTYIPFALCLPYISQLATGCSSSYLFPLTYIPFALCLPYISQLATRLLFLFPISTSYTSFALCLPYISQLATRCSFFSLFLLPTLLLRLVFLIFFNLQQVALSLTYFYFLHFFCALFALYFSTCN